MVSIQFFFFSCDKSAGSMFILNSVKFINDFYGFFFFLEKNDCVQMPAVISPSLDMIVRHQRKVSQTTAGILMGTNLTSKLLFHRSEGSQ